MKIKHIEGNTGDNLKFEVDGVIMYFWDSFKRSFISLDSFAQSYNFNKVVFKDTVEDITKWIQENEELVTAYISKATKAQALLDSYRALPKKKLVARFNEKEVLICEVDLTRGYVTVTANEVIPTKESILIEQGSEMWVDYFVQEEGMSERAAKKQVADEVRMNGIEAVADISLFSEGFSYRNADYAFDSSACGCLHEDIKKAFPENKILHKLIKMHLKEDTDMVEALWLYSQLKDSENYREEVIAIGKEIVKK